jgi:hypothetical protein
MFPAPEAERAMRQQTNNNNNKEVQGGKSARRYGEMPNSQSGSASPSLAMHLFRRPLKRSGQARSGPQVLH